MSEKVKTILREGGLSNEMLDDLSREELVEIVRAVYADARTDVLTGILNRRGFEARACAHLSRAQFTNTEGGALLVFDVNKFKEINDEQGHAAGDAALRSVATLLERYTRPLDVVGRIGGDEFAVYLPETSEDDAFALASRLCEKIFRDTSISLSFGVGHTKLIGTFLYGQLFAYADSMMYQMKRKRDS